MKNSIRSLVLLTVLLITAGSVRADSTPIIQGAVSGLEICQLTTCGSAIFVGFFTGQVGFNTKALGTIAVAVKHNALPDSEGECAAITGGEWAMWVGLRRFHGSTTGELCFNPNNTFSVTVTMDLDFPGTGDATFRGTLDHNVFPPTIKGFITQSEVTKSIRGLDHNTEITASKRSTRRLAKG